MRERKDFKRPEGKKSSRLVVIAAEGRETERIYFQELAESLCSSRVHVEFLRRDDNNSSPQSVYEQVSEFQKNYSISDDDQLWIVVDRDRWTTKLIKQIAQYCVQNYNLNFCLSNPCFELWLLLHVFDVKCCTSNEKLLILENRKQKKTSESYAKRLLRQKIDNYSESHYNAADLIKTIDDAIARAKELDVTPKSRWPQHLGTRAYLLAESILNLNI